ncbi:MAG: TlpA family protein disulfide reductase [Chitinophagaceae bacterium]|nr:TlpA family protein disulfide reductase [Chitinophagaceae bacterium]
MLFLQLLFSVLSFFSIAEIKPAGIQTGIWRGILTTNGGELPFNFETKYIGGKLQLIILNGEERIAVDEINMADDSVFIRLPVFDSEFRLKYTPQTLTGLWINHSRKVNNVFPFKAEFGKAYRFTSETLKPVDNISGKWEVDFSKGTEDSSKAVGIFIQSGNDLTGTFLTTSGDYRYLAGTVQGNEMLLSCFDGSHAFLFKATIDPAGVLNGMYYSGNHWQEPWIAHRNKGFELPDPASLLQLKAGYDKLAFSFPDAKGNMVSLADQQFQNKAVIVQVMGSWCPNCMDEVAFFSPLYDQYHSKGLEIIGLSYEKAVGEKAIQNIERLKQRFNVHYTILLAGEPGADAIKTLPMLTGMFAYPTTFFIDKTGNLRKIYSGINGPATGNEYEQWKDDTRGLVEKLLSE